MDVAQLERYLHYVPFLGQNPQIILDRILAKAKKYLSEDKLPLIQKAYDYAAEKHAGQLRLHIVTCFIVIILDDSNFFSKRRPDAKFNAITTQSSSQAFLDLIFHIYQYRSLSLI
jgi:hypothetical protein